LLFCRVVEDGGTVLVCWEYEDSWEERELEDPEDLGGVPMIKECEKRKRVGL